MHSASDGCPASATGPVRGDGTAQFDLGAGLAQAADRHVLSDAENALLASIETRLTQEVRRLIGALTEFGLGSKLICEEIPQRAQFCKSVSLSLTLLGFQLAIAFGKGLDKPIFRDDGSQYLADLQLSLDEFVREFVLDGRRFLAIALVDEKSRQVLGAGKTGK